MNQTRPTIGPPEAPLKGSEVAYAFMLGLTAVVTTLSVCLFAYSIVFAEGDSYYLSWYYLLSMAAFYVSGIFALITYIIQLAIPKEKETEKENLFIQIALFAVISIPVMISIWVYYLKSSS